jgi:hypothetical protein
MSEQVQEMHPADAVFHLERRTMAARQLLSIIEDGYNQHGADFGRYVLGNSLAGEPMELALNIADQLDTALFELSGAVRKAHERENATRTELGESAVLSARLVEMAEALAAERSCETAETLAALAAELDARLQPWRRRAPAGRTVEEILAPQPA